MSRFDLILFFSIFVPAVIQADDEHENSPKCPFVNPVCKCPTVERCENDEQCPKGQKCCLDCCGGHRCTTPVDERCNKTNEIFDECGSHCPPTCANHNPGPCILSCKHGCFCVEGFLRNSEGDCVNEKDCDKYF